VSAVNALIAYPYYFLFSSLSTSTSIANTAGAREREKK
jgi:hypothetical protein